MDRNRRDKASDLFKYSVFGTKVPFREAFPEIADIVVEINETGEGLHGGVSKRKLGPDSIGEFVNCSNPICYGGGFNLVDIIREMVSKKETEREDSRLCRGNEGSPKGRRIYRKCFNMFEIKINIKYR
jgi:hypothetical protein